MSDVTGGNAKSAGRLERWRGSLFGFQSPGYQLAIAAADRYASMIEQGALHPEKARRFRDQIQKIRDALEHRVWRLVPYPEYDMAWAELYHLRNELCQELPLARVVGEIVEEVSDDIGYLDTPTAKLKRDELEAVRAGMLENLGDQGASIKVLALRARLEALSQLSAQARNTRWLKVNMTRNRLAIMGVVMFFILMVVLALLGARLTSKTKPEELTQGTFYWLILFFGGLGGVISGIMDSESVETRASEYYIYRRLLYLRPFVGAALALVVYLALETKLIAIKGVGAGPTDPAYFVIAFVSGFAERAFIGQLLKAAGAAGSDAGPGPAAKTTNGK